jgi:Fic family protein
MAALEGNPFTFPEVQTLLEGITVGGRKVSEQEQIQRTSDAWNRLLALVESDDFELDLKTFFDIHRVVGKGEALTVGEFRTDSVGIAGTEFKTPKAENLPSLFQAGLAAIKRIKNVHERACALFLFGALNQFFWDGNRRTSRLMMSGELLRNGYDIINIPATRRLEFNQKMVRFYNTQDGTEMMGFLMNCIIGQ